jgi:pantoate--beta-alanine ligase
MKIVTTFEEARRGRGGLVGLVPTMGFFHEGHLSLMEAARDRCDTVLVSLFVNPLQFGPTEDLARYPRDPERDAALAAEAGVDVLFVPSLEEMYPHPPLTRVDVATLAAPLEGASRPGHFAGVATVVTKLFAGLRPDVAFFGRKDAQQLAIVRHMAADLSFPVEVVGRPIVRDVDGLALSSRNVYLSAAERVAALAISRSLLAAARAAEDGETDGSTLETMVRDGLSAEQGLVPDYARLVSAADVRPLDRLGEDAFLAVAARAGTTRLIDNVHLFVTDGRVEADPGIRLARPSLLGKGD